jgi:hypothetical protein
MGGFSGLGMGLGTLSLMSKAQTRSISAENPTGEKGKGAMSDPSPGGPARELGRGWKCYPCVAIQPGQVFPIAQIEGQGALQSLWMTGNCVNRDAILRIHWDGQEQPSVECPLPDFFASPWALQDRKNPGRGPFAPVNSLPVVVNPARGLNCFWEMPFRKSCRITLENLHPTEPMTCYYQVNYTLTRVPDEAAYFHAQFRRMNPLPYGKVYTILDGARGRGHYVGTSMGWAIHSTGWWGEGEIKFYLDGDSQHPTLCGTGTEDYFGGAYNWDVEGHYVTYTTPFLGMHQVLKPDGLYSSQHRHAMYRWHVMDPIRFEQELRVTIQALGWRSEGRFLPGQHDIASVAYWYQTLPTVTFPKLPDRNALEIV